jgi:RimJ/RimL family protein N-acetyltransferase
MKFKKKLDFLYDEQKCEFRSIFGSDLTDEYISELKKGNKYIENIPVNVNKQSQSGYINTIVESENNVICGLFVNSKLIGTAGIQNIGSNSISTIGLYIFDQNVRGQGFGKAIVWASCFLANLCENVEDFGAGMKKTNIPSFKSFTSCGFQISIRSDESYKVNLNIKDLLKPKNIVNVAYK